MPENPISLRSKSRFVEALAALLDEKPFDSITITELCARAGLSRPAFYQNFGSIRAVAVRYVQTALSQALERRHSARILDAKTYVKVCESVYEDARDAIDDLIDNGMSDIVVAQCTDAFTKVFGHAANHRTLFAAAGMANALAQGDACFGKSDLIDSVERLIG